MSSLVIEPDLYNRMKFAHKCDSNILRIKQYVASGKPSSFTIGDDGTLYFKGRLVVPKNRPNLNYVPHVMKEAHDTPLSKMYEDIRQRYWWSGMKQDIARYVDECDVCRRVKA